MENDRKVSTAFGFPGISPTFAAGDKDAVITALGDGRVWATVGGGVLNEIFWPHTGRPQTRDIGFLVSGPDWWVEVKRAANYTLTTPEPGVPFPTITHQDPRFDLVLEMLCDPNRDVVMIKYALTNHSAEDMQLHVLAAPHIGGSGHHNTAWVTRDALFAARGAEAMSIIADRPFQHRSAGYVGASDGWQDIANNGLPTWTFDTATDGNVALTATLSSDSGVVAIGFATNAEGAAVLARSALIEGYDQIAYLFRIRWAEWQDSLKLPSAPARLMELARVSAMVIRTHEDETFPGAIVASLATPWGAAHDDPGGYHLVWPRDCAETGLALAGLGRLDDARRMIDFLAATQSPDGHWAQNFTPDGQPYWTGIQLDETALPLILAAKLAELGALDEGHRDRLEQMIARGCRYLALNGPLTAQDRWEESPGANAFTLAALVAALSAISATSWLDAPRRELLASLADWWNERIEALLYVSDSPLDHAHSTKGHYARISSGMDADRPSGPRGTMTVANRDGETAAIEDMVGLEFLALVRYGLRAASDPRITDTVRIVDAVLKAPDSLLFHRYQRDGYGEHEDGSPFDGHGVGRLWPLLAGERGNYALDAGADPGPYLEAMALSTTIGGMLPEQVWDGEDLPQRRLLARRPSGSAAPLVWAHAEYLKLYLAVYARCHTDRLDSVADRYRADRGPAPIAHLRDETDLVVGQSVVSIGGLEPFTLWYGTNGWTDSREVVAEQNALGYYSVLLSTGELAKDTTTIEWTRRYEGRGWEHLDHVIRLKS